MGKKPPLSGARSSCLLRLRHANHDGGWTLWLMISAVTGQLQEMEMIRQKVYQLEQAQIKMKQE